jgi:hypothetical protein
MTALHARAMYAKLIKAPALYCPICDSKQVDVLDANEKEIIACPNGHAVELNHTEKTAMVVE